MKKKQIKAVFIGQDGSNNYINGKSYFLTIKADKNGLTSIQDDKTNGMYTEYESIVSFLNNWNVIRGV